MYRDRWTAIGFPQAADANEEKTDFFAFLAFDLPKPPTYNPRPRCFAAVAEKQCLSLNLDVKIVANGAV
jgi:hypothetical protein